MNMLLDTLAQLHTQPLTWIAVGLLAILSLFAFGDWLLCPVLHHKKDISVDEAKAAGYRPVVAGPRFFFVMVGGIGLTIAGLYMIQAPVRPDIGFVMILAGLVIMQTEPIRQQLRIQIARVIAASAQGEDAYEAATDGLRAGYIWLVAVHFLILAGVVAGLLAF
ncbi:MAG: hypothetical protein AAF568_09465 [Pseudomonadota bacterium]